jgi:hypothetical protein
LFCTPAGARPRFAGSSLLAVHQDKRIELG